MSDFDLFWDHYPMKKGKGYARKCFEKQKKLKILPDTESLIKAIHNQIKEKKYLKSQNRFVAPWKHPSTWLNQECWDDHCVLPSKPRPKNNSPAVTFDTLQRARNILHNLGPDKFEDYCRQIKMSNQDRDSILFPYQSGMKPESIAKRMFK
jgi:hypothetical protein